MKFQIKGDFFNGKFHLAKMSGTDAVEEMVTKFSPADLDTQLWVAPIENRHVEPVMESAIKGYAAWRKLTFDERGKYLRRFQEKVKERKDEMAEAIALETGKPLWEAHMEVGTVIAKVDVTLNEAAARIRDTHIPDIMPGVTGHVYYRPIGPCLVIGPFNFPCHLPNGQILSALAAGNSIIFKPSEKTIYSAQILIECLAAAEFPPGVINLINGKGEIARRLIKEKAVKGIFFTGSNEVGKRILKETSDDLTKLVALELGGKNTCIVHEDAQIDHALNELIKASFYTTGQRCVSTSKIAIHEKIQDEFIARFHQLAKNIIIDHPIDFEEEPFMGPLIDEHSMANYLLFMGMAIREGAEEIMRGKQIQKKYKGNYVSPSIHFMRKPDPNGHFLGHEIFGPNCTFIPYREIEEAAHIVNMSEYGLAAGLFTEQRALYDYCVQNLDVGILNFNRSTAGSSAKLPFGGVKNSGNYRPAALGQIDSCVFPLSSMEMRPDAKVDFNAIKGLKKK